MTIHITTPAELQDMESDLTADYILDNDLDMTGVVWVPIGVSSSFTGTFDGGGFTISNLTSDDTGHLNYFAGLFAIVDSPAVIQNLKLDNISLIANSSTLAGALGGDVENCTVSNVVAMNVSIVDDNGGGNFFGIGGLIGYCNNLTISDCSAQVAINLTVAGEVESIGGLIGDYNKVILSNCSSSGTIIIDTATNKMTGIGGLLGYFDGTDTSTISDSNSSVSITLTNGSPVHYVGGLIGKDGEKTTITNCYSTGNLSCTLAGDVEGLGGFIGNLGCVSVEQCYATGDVIFSGTDDNGVAGFAGQVESNNSSGLVGTVKDCYAHGNVTSTASGASNGTGGFIGQYTSSWNEPLKLMNCYAKGDVQSSGYAGGFIGLYFAYGGESTLENCYSVGVVTSDANQGGGFIGAWTPIGALDQNALINCSWYTAAATKSINSYSFGEFIWDGVTTYSIGDTVYQDKKIYQSLQNSNLNNSPDSSPTFWQLIFTGYDNLADGGWGTDEPDNTKFYTTDHPVYAQGT